MEIAWVVLMRSMLLHPPLFGRESRTSRYKPADAPGRGIRNTQSKRTGCNGANPSCSARWSVPQSGQGAKAERHTWEERFHFKKPAGATKNLRKPFSFFASAGHFLGGSIMHNTKNYHRGGHCSPLIGNMPNAEGGGQG